MTYIFTAPQLAGVIQQALETDDPLVLENVAFLAELFYQDEKENIKELTDQPWPERLVKSKTLKTTQNQAKSCSGYLLQL